MWRERDAGVSDITDAAPVPEWVLFLGKFLGLSLILITWTVLLIVAGMASQVSMDYYDFEIGLYLQVLFGLQLPDYLLLALLALTIHTVINQKYVAHLVAIVFYAFIAFSSYLGIEHKLLVFGSDPGWSYNEMRGFGQSLAPWLWFKLYWIAWALLFAVIARLFWVRSRDLEPRVRFELVRLRFKRPTAIVTAVAMGLIIVIGGFIFYNTNMLNEYHTVFEGKEWKAEYERRYGRYKEAPQPTLKARKLHVEIYPKRGTADIHGSYLLVNNRTHAIDSIHIATAPGVGTRAIVFDRPALLVIEDEDLFHKVYKLQEQLRPGDSVRLNFEVHLAPRGFTNNGASSSVVDNGTYFNSDRLLPAIGYQSDRELIKPGERRRHKVPARPLLPEAEETQDITEEEGHGKYLDGRIDFEAVVGTEEDQTAIAPGVLRRAWTKGGRRYFHYVSDAAIGTENVFFSAKYAKHEIQWKPSADTIGRRGLPAKDVTIQIFHHPDHIANVDRMARSAQATLEYCSSQFSPYPSSCLKVIENPIRRNGAHADATMVNYGQTFALFNIGSDPEALDLPFAVFAHEVAHQWWGYQLAPKFAKGAALLSESLAWYSAMGTVEKAYGFDHLQRLRRFFRQPHPIPPIRQSVPLLHAMDPYAAYRKGPFAMYTLRQYAGEERVNTALRRLIEKHKSGEIPLPTSLDLYRELKVVTPDSLKTLLHDLFEANTFWDLKTNQFTAKKTKGTSWEVKLDVQAKKVIVDPSGFETNVPMDEWIEVGVFAPAEKGDGVGKPLYVQKHRIRTGKQTITITVAEAPRRAAIDPYHLMIDLDTDDNYKRVKIE